MPRQQAAGARSTNAADAGDLQAADAGDLQAAGLALPSHVVARATLSHGPRPPSPSATSPTLSHGPWPPPLDSHGHRPLSHETMLSHGPRPPSPSAMSPTLSHGPIPPPLGSQDKQPVPWDRIVDWRWVMFGRRRVGLASRGFRLVNAPAHPSPAVDCADCAGYHVDQRSSVQGDGSVGQDQWRPIANDEFTNSNRSNSRR